MPEISLTGCRATPFGSYLKGLGIARLVSEQKDATARVWWDGDELRLRSALDAEDLVQFLLNEYEPTPIVAPWNGGSGFYEKDNKEGIEVIQDSQEQRFALYRQVIDAVQEFPEVKAGKAEKNDEEERRTVILLDCRNRLPDRVVEWLDATVAISAEGKRAFAPIVGTGGNEGRLDYTNNFMSRLAALLIKPDKKTPVRDLLEHALFGTRTEGLQAAAAGQFDPGRAGGANQGQGIEQGSVVNPWDFVLTMEGAVAWASGLYRRQGVSYRSSLCSPFTVGASNVGYGSSAEGDDARGEIWAPIWDRPARYDELRVLFREARADVDGKPARTGLQFAEAAGGLGTDRGVDRFVRYSLLKRRGDSYVALPAGVFGNRYRSTSDHIRQVARLLDGLTVPKPCAGLKRAVDTAMYEALLHDQAERLRVVLAALGRLIRRLATVGTERFWWPVLKGPNELLAACGAGDCREVRIAAGLASIWSPPIRDNLTANHGSFAWQGRSLPEKVISVLDRRLFNAAAAEARYNPTGGACEVDPGDVTAFIEGSTDDALIEDLTFAFTCLDWTGMRYLAGDGVEILPIYALIKHVFLPGRIETNVERKFVRADTRLLRMLQSNRSEDAAELAKHRLTVAGLNPIRVCYEGSVDGMRLAASLLLPVRQNKAFRTAAAHDQEQLEHA